MVRESLPACILKKLAEFLRLRPVWNQNRNSAGRYWQTQHIWYEFKKSKREPAIIWKRVNCQRITSKHTRPWWVDPWDRDTVRWYWSVDTLFWQQSIDDNIDVQSAFSWTPKVARKCESKHWYACGADGRSLGWSAGHVITKFSGMGRFIYPWCFAGAVRARSSAMNYLFLNRNFALKLQGNCWKDDVLTFTAHLSVTIKRLTRYQQKVVWAAMLEGKSMPSNMAANTNHTTLLLCYYYYFVTCCEIPPLNAFFLKFRV